MNAAAEILGALVTLGLAGVVVIMLALAASSFPLVFLTAALFIYVLENFRYDPAVDTSSGGLILAGLQWYPMDLVLVVSLLASAWLALRGDFSLAQLRVPTAWLVTLTALVAVGLLTSMLGLGLATGVNTWRYWLYSMGFLWWSVAALGKVGTRSLRPFILAGVFAACVQIYGFATAGFGSASSRVLIDGYYVDVRPLHASAALIMTAGLLVLLLKPVRRKALQISLSLLLLGSIAASQQRTVWIATAMGLLLILAFRSDRAPRSLALFVVGVAALAFLAFSNWNAGTSRAFEDSATNTKTWNYRLELWADRLEVLEGGRLVWGTVVSPLRPDEAVRGAISNHSMLLDTLFGVGAIGLLGVFVLSIAAWRATPMVRPVLASIVVFGVSYAWPVWSWVVVGIGLVSTRAVLGKPRVASGARTPAQPRLTSPNPAVGPGRIHHQTAADPRMRGL